MRDEMIDSRAEPFGKSLVDELMVRASRFPAIETESARQITEQSHTGHFEVAAGKSADSIFARDLHFHLSGKAGFGEWPDVWKFWNVEDLLWDDLHLSL